MRPPNKSSTLAKKRIHAGRLLPRYVKKTALFAMLFAVIGLWGLQLVFSYLSELDNISDTYSYWDAIKYIGYRAPYFLEQFIATGALLGAVVGLGLLANNAELMVMRAAGISIYRIIGWVLQPALIFVFIALAVNQYVLPQTNLLANQIRRPDISSLAAVNGYWTLQSYYDEQGERLGNQIVFIDYADADGNIGTVKRWQLDDDSRITAVSTATNGHYLQERQIPIRLADSNAEHEEPINKSKETDLLKVVTAYQWQLNDVSTIEMAKRPFITGADASALAAVSTRDHPIDYHYIATGIIDRDAPIVSQRSQLKDTFTLPISPNSIYLLTRQPEDLSLTQLYEHKQFSAAQGTRSLKHEVAFWQKLLSPFAILSLVLLACSFVFGSLRSRSLGLRIVIALLCGLLFSYLQDLVGFISLATGASPLLMVLLPIIGSALLGLYLVKRQD